MLENVENNHSSHLNTVAAFDFDGTMTYCDSLMPFLLYLAGPVKWSYHLFILLPTFFLFLMRRRSRKETKEAVLNRFIKNMPLEELKSKGAAFAESKLLEYLVRSKALVRLHWHKEKRHRCILISASLDIYLSPWAKLMGFDDLICSSLEIDAEGKVTGKLNGENCRGEEKIRRLEALLGPRKDYILYAYGDSNGDKELLAYADHGYYKTMPQEEE